MKATEDLRAEHKGVLRMLDIIDATSRRTKDGQPVDVGDLEQIIDFLRVFVDKCHHTKEEDLLFPALRAEGVTKLEGVVADLRDEHGRGREKVAQLASLATALKQGDDSANQALARVMTDYSDLLRAHIRHEEDDCFDVADAELPANVQDELEAGYDRIESEVVGGGVHEAFHALLDRLEQKAATH